MDYIINLPNKTVKNFAIITTYCILQKSLEIKRKILYNLL